MDEVTNETIRAASKGNEAAFEAIYHAYGGMVFNIAARILGNREDAKEASQEVFLTVYRKLAGFSHRSSLKTWLYRITTNTAINHIRKRTKEQDRTIPYHDEIEMLDSANQVDDNIDQQHREKLVTSLLSGLNLDQRTCIVLRNIEGLSYEEIATALEININTVRSRLKRGREKLLSMGKKVTEDGM